MLSKKYKIIKKEDFNLLYKNGITYHSKHLKILILPNNLKSNRFSIVVSKKISAKATVRNATKRKLKHILPSLDTFFPTKVDALLIAHAGIGNLKTNILIEEIKNIIKRITL
ncbi:MAG: ribonuclease P protein component [Parcubacteria group bacterium]|jgi:ribonuclease P protein component